MQRSFRLAFFTLSLLLPTLASAATGGSVRASIDTGAGGSRARGELILPLTQRPQDGWVQRYWADWTEARDSADESRRSAGVGWGLGYRAAGEQGYAAAYVGPHYRRYSAAAGADDGVELQLQLQGEAILGPDWRLSGDISYLADSDLFWAEGSLLRRMNDRLYIGPYAAAEGTRDDHSRRAGVLAKVLFPKQGLEAGVKVGVDEYGDDRDAFIGLELEKHFE